MIKKSLTYKSCFLLIELDMKIKILFQKYFIFIAKTHTFEFIFCMFTTLFCSFAANTYTGKADLYDNLKNENKF